jgi:hypothetical protein
MDAMKILDLIFPFSAEKYYRLLDERKVHEEGTIVRFRRRELIVFRHEGRYFVYRNVCPHRSKSGSVAPIITGISTVKPARRRLIPNSQ